MERENKHGDPIFLLHFSMSCAWISIVPSLTEIWIVRRFQGNYIKHECREPELVVAIDLIGVLNVVPNSDLPGLRICVCCICMIK